MVKAAPPDLAAVVETGRHHICAHADHGMLPDTDAPAADGGAHIGSGVSAAEASTHIGSGIDPGIDLCRRGGRGNKHDRGRGQRSCQ
jgi:hypothetical protein